MSYLVRLTVALSVSGLTVALCQAQPPAANSTTASSRPSSGMSQSANRRRSIVHHYPLPYPEYYHGEASAGFRNPGGTGRFLEYYPPGDQFQQPSDRVRVAKFDQGAPGTGRADQFQALQVGVQRQNSIQQHIDNYARPAFGVGYFGGFY